MIPQHAYQPTAMDVNWEPMQRNRLLVKIVNKLPGHSDRRMLAVNRETVKLLAHPRTGHVEAPTSNSVRDVLIRMQAHLRKALQIGPTST